MKPKSYFLSKSISENLHQHHPKEQDPHSQIGRIGIYNLKKDQKKILRLIEDKASNWQKDSLKKSVLSPNAENGGAWSFISDQEGPYWVLARPPENLEPDYVWFREKAAFIMGHSLIPQLAVLELTDFSASSSALLGFLVGIDLYLYDFKTWKTPKLYDQLPLWKWGSPFWKGGSLSMGSRFQLKDQKEEKKSQENFFQQILDSAISRSFSMNVVRHLVNTPSNQLDPLLMTQEVEKIFSEFHQTSIEIWSGERLKKEKMHLLLAVGGGAAQGPCLVQIHYRPKVHQGHKRPKALQRSAPFAFIGKGITFDTGGLDIKPSSGMRLMKKDMSGAALLIGVALWANLINYPLPIDFFLSIAENSVSSQSMKPGDVYTARSGQTVEIHNTDAEGRLVLADALALAVETPREWIVDVASLTGACRVALGYQIAGLFSNEAKLTKALHNAGNEMGDYNWPLPLFQKYFSQYQTQFADFTNASEGQGGAITAALFLEKFVNKTPWAHFDMMAWADQPTGSLRTVGGNAQVFQCLIHFLTQQAK